jgi:signal transduction histidine kinase
MYGVVHDMHNKINDVKYIKIKKDIHEKITLDDLCTIYKCSVVYINYETFYYDKNELKKIVTGERYFEHIYKALYLDKDAKTFNIKVEDTYIEISLLSHARYHIELFTVYIPLMLVLFSIFLYRLLKDEMFYAMLHKNTIVNDMEIMTAIRVGENTAHEIRTPLDVLTSKLHKIRETINGYILVEKVYLDSITTIPEDRKRRHGQLKTLEEDFKLMDMSLTHIADQVDTMSNYKNLLHSNGNKNLHDIIDFARRSMVMGHDNIVIHIDKEFLKYGVSGMKNSEMLGIFINHFKNSIEANSSRIEVNIINIKESMMTLTISDNGNGIPDELKPHIFDSGRSSKQKIGSNEVIRGHGMFNNKVLITKIKGNILIDRRYKKGTMFIITIPVVIKKEANNLDAMN